MSSSGIEKSVDAGNDERGREVLPPPAVAKGSKRGKSRDVQAAFEARLTRAEDVVADFMQKCQQLGFDDEEALSLGDLCQELKNLQARVQTAEEAAKNALIEKETIADWLQVKITEQDRKMAEQGKILEEMKKDWAMCREAIARGTSTHHVAPKVDVPRPSPYNGKREAKEVDNFFWQIEQYFDAVGLEEDASRVKTATLYFSEDAALWWRMKHQEFQETKRGLPTWTAFKEDVYAQFYPEEAEWEARDKLRVLKHIGTIHQYVQEYISLKLQVRNKPDYDHMYDFIKGLQPWAQQEVRMRKPKTFAQAVAMAESLIEVKEKNNPTEPPRDLTENGGEDESSNGQDKDRHGRQPFNKDEKRDKRSIKCYFCLGSHPWRECPRRQTLNMLIEEREKIGEAQIGSLQLLNALNAKMTPRATSRGGLMYVEALIQGKLSRAMLDTGASHNFMAEDEAKRLGLTLNKSQGSLKTVNSASRPLTGVVKDVSLTIGTWQGKLNFTVVPMDDFELVLGMEFFRQAKAIPTPHLEHMMIMEENTPCMVPAKIQARHEKRQLSTLQVDKGVRQHEGAYSKAMKGVNKGEQVADKTPKEAAKGREKVEEFPSPLVQKKALPMEKVNPSCDATHGAKPKRRATIGDETQISLNLHESRAMGKKPVEVETSRRILAAHTRESETKFKTSYPQMKQASSSKICLDESASNRISEGSRGKEDTTTKSLAATLLDPCDKEIDFIEADCVRGLPPRHEYLVHWKGLPASKASWEPTDSLENFMKEIVEYHEEIATRTFAEMGGGVCHALPMETPHGQQDKTEACTEAHVVLSRARATPMMQAPCKQPCGKDDKA